MSPHPKAVEAAARSQEARLGRQVLKTYVADCQAKGMHFFEIHPRHGGKHGHMTVGYFQQRRNIYAVATSLCHPDDTFDKVKGRALVADGMAKGGYILLRKPSKCTMTPRAWLDMKFREYFE